MAFYAYRLMTNHSNENEQFSKLCRILQSIYGNREEDVYLLGNCNCSNYVIDRYNPEDLHEHKYNIDALIVRREGVIVVDFKSYSGYIAQHPEYDHWVIRDSNLQSHIIMSNKEQEQTLNPLRQLTRIALGFVYEMAGRNKDKRLYPVAGIKDLFDMDAWHLPKARVSTFAVFNQLTNDDAFFCGEDFHFTIRPWFRALDFNRIQYALNNMASTPINMDKVPELINYFGLELYTSEQFMLPPKPPAQDEQENNALLGGFIEKLINKWRNLWGLSKPKEPLVVQ